MVTDAEAFCLGVTGHRPGGLKNADWGLLRARIKRIFSLTCTGMRHYEKAHKKGLGGGVPVLRVISPLAEGADQIVAEEGLSAGGKLYCPLPFQQDEYEKDFSTPEAVNRFRNLLKKASFIHVIGKSGKTEAERNASYVSAGREVLRQSDILIAVWDGNRARGTGGTAQIVGEAKQAGIPVIWVHSQAPHLIEILFPEGLWKKRRNKILVEEWIRL